MKATEFCYWLQGYFEISGADSTLSYNQFNQLRKKLAQVSKDQTPGSDFVTYLRGVLDAVQQLPLVTQADQAPTFTALIKARLNDTFLHAIDPTIKGDQQQQRRLHRPDGDGGPVPMC